jgi:hypothetical protein
MVMDVAKYAVVTYLSDTQDPHSRFPRELCALVTGNQEESL